MTLTPLLYATLRAVDGKRDLEAIAAVVSDDIGRYATAEDIEYLVDRKLRPLGLLRLPDGNEPVVQRLNPLLALRLRFAVTNPALTRRLTEPFAWLFTPAVAVPVLTMFALASWWLLFQKGLASATHEAFYQPAQLLLVWVVVVCSAAFHEFGHAAACRYGGATPGVMGAGLYLVWPAFYTEVSDSYRLGRWGRLRVDLGGLYFNTVFALATMAVWAVTRTDALLLVVVAQHVQMVRQLAPFIRADGYHIVADLTGVPDLFAHIKPTLLSLVPKPWGGRPDSALKTWARVVVTAWVLVVVPLLFMLLLSAVRLFPHLAATAWDSMRGQWAAAGYYWHQADMAGVLVRLLYTGVVMLPVLGIAYVTGRIGLRTQRRVWAATEGRPRQRGLAVTAGAVALGLLAWSWWPGQQYRPIHGNEGGTLGQLILPTNGSHADIHKRYLVPGYIGLARPGTLANAGPAAARSSAFLRTLSASAPATPSFYLTRPGAGAAGQGVLSSSSQQPVGVVVDPGGRGWVFPFSPPAQQRNGDNRALAVNTSDGSYATALAVAWAIVTDGTVDQRNEAYAFASCTDCATLAVSLQVLLLVGSPEVVAPVNSAEAVNYACERCRTAAIASQMVVSLTGMPSDVAKQKVASALRAVELLKPYLGRLSTDEIYLILTAAKAQIVQALASDGVLAPVAGAVANEVSAVATPTPTSEPTSTTGAAVPSDTPSVGAADAASPTSSPQATSSDTASSSPEPSPTSDPSASASPTGPESEAASPSPGPTP